MNQASDLSVVLLHDHMWDKQGKIVTTSLTLLDLHDIARSCRTYEVKTLYIAHPSAAMRKIARTMKTHWEDGFGATYNPNRKEALERIQIVASLADAIQAIDLRTGKLPTIVATSAKEGEGRVHFQELSQKLHSGEPYLLMLGTGWGMSEDLLNQAQIFLEPIAGCGEYNHLSVRSACAIMLDRLLGR